MTMRIGFATCVELGLSCIEAAAEMGGRFDLLVTLRDDLARAKSGRVYLDDIAARYSMPLRKIRHINDTEAIDVLKSYELDWLFVIGWSQILSPAALRSVDRGVLGMHPTLLPVGRGRAAIPWAILKGLDQTGVTLFKLDGGVDTGPIVAQQIVPIDAAETATTLYHKVNNAHRELMMKVWPAVRGNALTVEPQDECFATEWPGRCPEDGRIDPTMGVMEAERLIRATTRPYPGAFFELPGGLRLRVWAGSHEPPHSGAQFMIRLSDGVYFATHFEYEQQPGATPPVIG